jgi:hypothetical protein
MASRRERPVTSRHQERLALWQHLEVAAAGPGLLSRPLAVEAAAEFEQSH